jgi:hypothetical protein
MLELAQAERIGNMRRFVQTCVALILTLTAMVAVSHADEMANYRMKYEKTLEEILLAQGMRLSDLNSEYTRALDRVRVQAKQRGDLEAVKMTLAEIDRFQNEKNIPVEKSQHLDIKRIQVACANRSAQLEIEKTRRILTLATQYDTALLRLQRQLTSADKLHAATAAQTERQRLAESDTVAAAKAAIAALALQPNGGTRQSASARQDHTPLDKGESPKIPRYCPEGTIENEGHYYYLLPNMMVREDAKKACRKLRGHLVSLDSEAEYNFIVKQFAGKRVWLDLTDEKREGRWLNWRGKKATFMHWGGGEPNGGNHANVAEIKQGMNDTVADALDYVVCEWER